MWKELKISERTHFMRCSLLADEVKCLLYDLKGSWCETLKLEEVLNRVKALNRRIQYDEETTRNTLEQGEPTMASWEQDGGNDNATGQKTLKLKYHVRLRPFNFEWHLQPQTEEQFTTDMMTPLFKVLHGMTQQIEELQQAVRKKDIEISQYKEEYGTLKIKILATKPFDFTKFDGKYAETRKWTIGADRIAQQLQVQSPQSTPTVDILAPQRTTRDSDAKLKTELKDEEQEATRSPKTRSSKEKISPRNRKRRELEQQQRRLERKVNARKRKLEYQNSESFSVSHSDSSTEVQRKEKVTMEVATNPSVQLENEEEDDMPTLSTTDEASNELPTANYVEVVKKECVVETPRDVTVEKSLPPESEISKEVDAILKELKELEKRRIADMESRSESTRTRSKR